MPTLQELKGQRILAKFSGLAGQIPAVGIVKLVEVETAGIWIENERLTQEFLAFTMLATTPKTPVFFVPYGKIEWIFSAADYPALLEKAFGL